MFCYDQFLPKLYPRPVASAVTYPTHMHISVCVVLFRILVEPERNFVEMEAHVVLVKVTAASNACVLTDLMDATVRTKVN